MPVRRIRITGLVQGVFFRANAKKKAEELGVRGWVLNNDDGSVSVHAEGAIEALDRLEEWCRNGPPGARVEEIRSEECEEKGFTSFEIRYV